MTNISHWSDSQEHVISLLKLKSFYSLIMKTLLSALDAFIFSLIILIFLIVCWTIFGPSITLSLDSYQHKGVLKKTLEKDEKDAKEAIENLTQIETTLKEIHSPRKRWKANSESVRKNWSRPLTNNFKMLRSRCPFCILKWTWSILICSRWSRTTSL